MVPCIIITTNGASRASGNPCGSGCLTNTAISWTCPAWIWTGATRLHSVAVEEVGYQGTEETEDDQRTLPDRQARTSDCHVFSEIWRNTDDVHDIEKVIGDMFNDLEKSHIRVDGLFLNADAGFDCDVLRGFLGEKRSSQTSASINGEKMPMTSLLMMNYMLKGIPSNEPTLGWTVSGRY